MALLKWPTKRSRKPCEQCGRATTRRIDGLAVCLICVPKKG